MHILNVNSYLDLKTGGGTAERTFQMSRFLARQGAQCTVLALDIGLDQARKSALAPAQVVTLACISRRFFIPYPDWRTILRLVRQADIVHLMGHWGILNACVYLALRWTGTPYVVCPAGALPVFGRSGRLKRLYNFMIGAAIIRNAAGWIAITNAERAHFPAYGIPAERVTVIPNGVSGEDFPPVDTGEFLKRRQLPDVPFILFMGRLNLIKGPDILLQAFLEIAGRLPHYHLVFAGPDGGMLAELQRSAAQMPGRVHFLGYVGGADKSAAYRSARLLVVPSRSEAMSIVVLESGICGTPVLMTDQCGFSDITSVHPALEVPATVAGVASGMLRLLATPELLAEVAPAWRNFVERGFAWDAIAPRYISLYRGILDRLSPA
jgi:glycosyltransferase involved in cell wall biosynthesis